MINKKKFSSYYFEKVNEVSSKLDKKVLDNLVEHLIRVKKNRGRIFFLGVGGSAGNCSHAVNDFRKLCNIESYTPVDNVSELTARINDEGWDNSFKDWLVASNFNKKDILFILSVGGGNKNKNVSTNLIKAIDLGIKKKSKIIGIVGKNDGYLAKKGNCVAVIPYISQKLITPLAEAFQAVIWHFLVSHPKLQVKNNKW
jgi:D-sedoheptulose 7-phosphate isomerase